MDRLKLSIPQGGDEADKIANANALADLQAREKLLQKNIADLEKLNAMKKEAPVASGAKPPTKPVFVGNKTFGRIKSMQCLRADVAPPPPPARHELTAWDGVVRKSPGEAYNDQARGGLDAVRGDSWHHQQSVNAQDAIIGEGFGVIIGKLLGLGSKMIGTVRGSIKPVPKPMPEPLPKALPERPPAEPKPKTGPGNGTYVEKPTAKPKPRRKPRQPRTYEKKVENMDGSTTYTLKTKDGNLVDVTYRDGYPDFSPYKYDGNLGKPEVEIRMTGDNNADFSAANREAGFGNGIRSHPDGYTWHHNQDGKTMQLVRTDVHSVTPHTGGASAVKP